MPGDSINLNIKAKKQHSFDAIVVGSGISGGWAAKELCEKGLKVLLLDRGKPIEHPNYPTATKDPWDFEHHLKISSADKKRYPVQSRHWSFREDNKHFYLDDLENPYKEEQRFDWIRGNTIGGRSLLWSRACYRWSDLDFEANAKDGHGVDWPIRYKDLEYWYHYAETFIGVSGNQDRLPYLPDGSFLPAFDMNAAESDFKQRIESAYRDRYVIMGRYANLTRSINGRGPCMARDLCHRGCPFGAYFSSNSATLPAAALTGNLTIRPYSLVNRVLYDETKQVATGVEITDTQTKESIAYYARIVFLNAATVGTTFILLNSISNRFPNGMGNGSDQVGRNLMDHHKGLSASASIEGFEDQYYYGRRPSSIYIPRFKNITQQEKGFLRGYNYGASAWRERGNGEQGIGSDLKESLSEPGKWNLSLYAFGECLPYADNRITLDKHSTDNWGRPLLNIDCSFKENERIMNQDLELTAREMLETTGYKNIRITNNLSFPGNANHEMGTARMGRDPKTSVLNGFNQLHEVRNVFITDGSCMTSSSCVNPSLTFMALTARACNYAIDEMKKQNI